MQPLIRVNLKAVFFVSSHILFYIICHFY
jgi:hypothetical protein